TCAQWTELAMEAGSSDRVARHEEGDDSAVPEQFPVMVSDEGTEHLDGAQRDEGRPERQPTFPHRERGQVVVENERAEHGHDDDESVNNKVHDFPPVRTAGSMARPRSGSLVRTRNEIARAR